MVRHKRNLGSKRKIKARRTYLDLSIIRGRTKVTDPGFGKDGSVVSGGR